MQLVSCSWWLADQLVLLFGCTSCFAGSADQLLLHVGSWLLVCWYSCLAASAAGLAGAADLLQTVYAAGLLVLLVCCWSSAGLLMLLIGCCC